MIRKLLVVLAAVGVSLAVATPASAHPVATTVQGGLDLALNTPCDLDGNGTVDPDELDTFTATFTGVVITGTFGSSGQSYTGQVTTPGITACNRIDTGVTVGGNTIPILSSGRILGGPFGTGNDDVGIATDLGPACLDGQITGGTFETTGTVAKADFDLEWTITRPLGPTCGGPSGAVLGSAPNQPVRADVVAIPLGNATGGTLPSIVTGVVTAT